MLRRYPSVLILLLGLVYAWLFFHFEMGLNLLLFDAVLIGTSLWVRPDLARHRGFVWSIGGLLFAAGSVIIVHGPAALYAHHLTYLLVVGFAQARELRFIWFGLLLGILSLGKGTVRWPRYVWRDGKGWIALIGNNHLSWLRLSLLAVFLAFPFICFYAAGNPRFAAGISHLAEMISAVNVKPAYWRTALLILFGTSLIAPLLIPQIREHSLLRWQAGFRDALLRKRPRQQTRHPASVAKNYQSRSRLSYGRPRPKMLALRNEYRLGMALLMLLNVLLAIVNATDLYFVWLLPAPLSAAELSQYVHAGTYNLIFSIVLAMLVVLYFFRGNQNFLTGGYLRPLAGVWLGQNALLAASVALRNWHYIDAYGLALGRIYVAAILLMIIFGLFTLWRKVSRKLSLTYIFHTNGMAFWLALLLFGAVNWTNVVTRYNLAVQPPEEIDWHYLDWGLDERNYFLLARRADFSAQSPYKRGKYLPTYTDWRSWNYPAWRNRRALKKFGSRRK